MLNIGLFFIVFLLLQGGYPARLKKVLIVTAPLWFKAPFKILRLFVREKLRERVFTVSVPQLSLHVPRESLPQHLGGTALNINHSTWLHHCHTVSMTNREDELLANIGGSPTPHQQTQQPQQQNNQFQQHHHQPPQVSNSETSEFPTDDLLISTTANATTVHHNHNQLSIDSANEAFLLSEKSTHEDAALNNQLQLSDDGSNQQQLSELWSENPPSSASSGFSDDDSLAGAEGDLKTIEQVVDMVRERGRIGLVREYAEIRERAPDGTFANARLAILRNCTSFKFKRISKLLSLCSLQVTSESGKKPVHRRPML